MKLRALSALLLSGMLLSACTSAAAGSVDESAGEATITQVAIAERKPAPTVTGSLFDGTKFVLEDHRGSLVVLNFWASWCPPCRAEGPGLVRASKEFASQGVEFFGVNTKETDAAAARAYLAGLPGTYPSLDDSAGSIGLAFTTNGTLPPNAIPSTIVIDRQGRLAARVLGPITQPRLTALLTALLKEPS